MRETMLPGAVLCRVAASHLRVGTFQYAAATGDRDAAAAARRPRHRPPLPARRPPRRTPTWRSTSRVVDAQASLVARWMLVGFVHGVMNTDNMTISGETIDYGPCAFMEAFDPATVFSSIDHGGRYAYGNQPRDRAVEPRAARRDAAALIDADTGRGGGGRDEVLRSFADALRAVLGRGHAPRSSGCRHAARRRAGRRPADAAARPARRLHGFFRALSSAGTRAGALFAEPAPFDAWAARWRRAAAADPSRRWRRRWTGSTRSTSRATTTSRRR